MSGISETSVFENKILEDGINYYLFPEKYPLFKANSILHLWTFKTPIF
jgi:hypothetical protein